jgi:hypothetical protein
VVLDDRGEIVAVVIGVGGFIGLGEKEVAVEIENLRFTRGPGGELQVVLAISPEQLERMPGLDVTGQIWLYSRLTDMPAEQPEGYEDDQMASAEPPLDIPTEDESAQIYLATRAFAGPYEIPPDDISAYGIVAFPTLPTSADEQRYMWVCEAFVSALQSEGEARESRPEARQMVTFWPMSGHVPSGGVARR